jgi:3-phenylpropionate/cinnamic acid dioxygenase small subunit
MASPAGIENPDLGDTSRFSYHVDDGFYARLLEDCRLWSQPAAPAPRELAEECEAFLFTEAWLLDEGRLEEWLELFTPDCAYWIPTTPGGGEPRTEVTLGFDDRRRLEDRVYWLRSGYVWSQIPPSRTRRVVGNVQVVGEGQGEVRVRSNFVIHEVRAGRQRILSGWYGHRLRRMGHTWKIAVKQVNLIDSDQAHEVMTIVL